jgi:hypothetical protein
MQAKFFDKIIILLMMAADIISETMGFCPELTRFIPPKDIIGLSRRKTSFHFHAFIFSKQVISSLQRLTSNTTA